MLPEKSHVQKHAWRFEDGTAVEMEWDMYKPGIGNTVTVTTGDPPPCMLQKGDLAMVADKGL